LRIAVTADIHLTQPQSHPGRFLALENILDQMLQNDISTLIVAGDLFHQSGQNYVDFDTLCSGNKYENLKIYAIPGNHDAHLSNSLITAQNVEVIDQPRKIQIGESSPDWLMIPYKPGTDMGRQLAEFSEELKPGEWILVAHGDWIPGIRPPNPMEPGVYMPLTHSDLSQFQPARVFLGHIHKFQEHGNLYIPGSPYPMDVTETGIRRFLVMDTYTGKVESLPVQTDVVYFDETLLVSPVQDILSEIRRAALEMRSRWNVDPGLESRVQLRLKVRGYTADLRMLKQALNQVFHDIAFYRREEPDLRDVHLNTDEDLMELARHVVARVKALDWPEGPEQPTRDEILASALRTVFED
jgi:DNA repair exonuclease SbcCD nuclease subunit